MKRTNARATPEKTNKRFMRDFFKGLKVVELASVLAGPAVGTFFAEMGASVIKVENKLTNGDVTRGWRVNGENPNGLSAYYSSVNYGKEILMVDLNDESDRSKIESIIKEADIIVSNYLPRVAQKFSLDYESVKRVNPTVNLFKIDRFQQANSLYTLLRPNLALYFLELNPFIHYLFEHIFGIFVKN